MIFISRNNPFFSDLKEDFYKTFWELFKQSDLIEIAVGYITAESLNKITYELKPTQKLFLNIGQHYQEGFSPNQLIAINHLIMKLKKNGNGEIKVFKPSLFHGKVYRFHNGTNQKVIIGSSNLSSIEDGYSNIEVNAMVENGGVIEKLVTKFL